MLRNLFLAGLTAVLLGAMATAVHAARGTGARKKTDTATHGQANAPEAERPLRPSATAKKKVTVKVRARTSPAKRRVTRRVYNAVVNQGLIRQSWTIADLNPMPALLDLDDTTKSLRRATAEIIELMRR